MDTELAYRLITFLLLLIALFMSSYFRRKAEREGGAMRSTEGRGLVAVLRLLGLVALLPLFGYWINPAWVSWARFYLPDWIRWLAALVAAGAIPVFYWILASIGVNISPTHGIRRNHQLVTHGPYRWVRHPLYTSGTVFAAALILTTTLWWLAAGAVIPLIILLLRTPLEEARLIETFGDEYRAYMRRTGRFLPRLSR